MVSYILFNVGCFVKVSLKLCFGNKVPTTGPFESRVGYLDMTVDVGSPFKSK